MVNLFEIPWFIVCSEGDKFEGDCWTAQCEIPRLLGGGAKMKNSHLVQMTFSQICFNFFFGFGQPGNGPNEQPHPHINQPNQNLPANGPNLDGINPAAGWGLWPNELNPEVQQKVPVIPGMPQFIF